MIVCVKPKHRGCVVMLVLVLAKQLEVRHKYYLNLYHDHASRICIALKSHSVYASEYC
jgi:hypothetical protein